MAGDPNNLIWIDMEMTGLQPDSDRVIEIAMLVTDPQLNVLATGPVLVVHQPDEVLDGDGLVEQEHARQERPDRESARLDASTEADGRAPGARVPRRARAGERLADVRQLDLPGPPLPRALDAAARGATSTTATSTSRR